MLAAIALEAPDRVNLARWFVIDIKEDPPSHANRAPGCLYEIYQNRYNMRMSRPTPVVAKLTKSQVVDAVSERTDLSKKTVGKVVDSVLDQFRATLAGNEHDMPIRFGKYVIRRTITDGSKIKMKLQVPEFHEIGESSDSQSASQIFEDLRGTLGERKLRAILKATIERLSIESSLDQTDADVRELETRNAMRLAVTRASVLANAVNSDGAGALISRSRPVVNLLAKSGKLLAIQDGRYLRFPRWQFDEHSEDGIVPGLQQVLAVMDASPFRKAAWFISPNPRLESCKPIELLRRGEFDRVYAEAKAVVSG